MDRFSFPDVAKRMSPGEGARWMPVLCLVGGLSVPLAHAGGPPTGLLVQFKPGVVQAEADVPPVVARDTPQAQRERAHARWQRQHASALRHFDQVAADAGVAVAAVGSAGAALRVDLPPGSDAAATERIARRLRLHPDVAEVVPNERLRRAAVQPTDPLFAQQWHLQSPAAFAGAINATAGWVRSTGGAVPVTVAVVDSGVRFDHPDLSGKVLAGYDFVSEVDYANDGNGRDADASDPGDWVTAAEASTALFQGCDAEDSSWHGTAIAGVIAAGANNAQGGVGVHWGAQILPVRVGGKCGAVLSDLLDGVRWAAGLPVAGAPVNTHPAKVINLSYGGDGACNTAYQSTLDDVAAVGALVVVAAGNAGAPVTRPADCRGVLAVTAVRGDGAKADYASYGPTVGLAAPGGSGRSGTDGGLLTTVDTGKRGPSSATYESVAGTSFAAPLASGVAALALSVQPNLSGTALLSLLVTHVRPHTDQSNLASCSAHMPSQGTCNCTAQTCGSGLLDVDLVLAAAQAQLPTTPVTPPPTTAPSKGGGGSTGWLWGVALWLWLWAVRRSQVNRKLAASCP
ncbi:MAG: S8 family peptidase [Burkholderiales bacterium]|nr:S8 family peptidase [Burkholderiales bacterium]